MTFYASGLDVGSKSSKVVLVLHAMIFKGKGNTSGGKLLIRPPAVDALQITLPGVASCGPGPQLLMFYK